MVGILIAGLLCSPALADEGDAPDLPPADRTAATPLPPLTPTGLKGLQPTRRALPPTPYSHTGFTAYTLEWGEAELGIGGVRVGAIPRVQIGTIPSALVVGVPNGQIKIDALRLGIVDVAATGSMLSLPAGDFQLRQFDVGGVVSTRVLPRWSVHIGAGYEQWLGAGQPDVASLPWVFDLVVPDAANWQQTLDYVTDGEDIEVRMEAIELALASDIRFNRRDSLVFQAQADIWAQFNSTFDTQSIPDDVGVKPLVDQITTKQDAPIANTYVATASWQFAWRRANLRIGGGLSSVPGAWALQSTEFTWSFGGKTRASERRMHTQWRKNKEALEKDQEASREI